MDVNEKEGTAYPLPSDPSCNRDTPSDMPAACTTPLCAQPSAEEKRSSSCAVSCGAQRGSGASARIKYSRKRRPSGKLISREAPRCARLNGAPRVGHER